MIDGAQTMSKLSDYLAAKKIDARRLLVASKGIERTTPEDRTIKLAKRRAKGGDDGAKEVAAKKPHSGRALTQPTLDRALRGEALARRQRARVLRAVNAVLANKKQAAAAPSDLF
jgi:hypothetical protein